MPSRSMAGESFMSWETFSSSVMREIRSFTRRSVVCAKQQETSTRAGRRSWRMLVLHPNYILTGWRMQAGDG